MPISTPHIAQQHPKLWIVVPAYNEGTVIRHTLQELIQAGYQVLVVDDGSDDDTQNQIADLPIRYLRHQVNLGQGAALSTGLLAARQLGAEYVVHFDADGQHPVVQIPDLLDPLLRGEADITMGSRFLNRVDYKLVPWPRRLTLWIGRLVNAAFTGLWLSDAHNGFRAMNQRAIQVINLKQPRMAHATEILHEVKRHHLRWKEVPVRIRYTDYSRSKGNSLWDGFGIVTELFINRMN